MKKEKILVCGATGFIGRNVIEYFSKTDEYEIYGTYFNSNPYLTENVTWIKIDLRDHDQVDALLKQGFDIIIQAAATTSGSFEIINRPYYHVTDNAIMNSLIFRSAYDNRIKHVVFFSCSTMYKSSDIPVKESDFDANADMYPSYFGVGWTKVYIEKMCEFYSRISDTKYTVIRHSNIYGPYDKYDLEKSHVFGATITKVMTAPDGGHIVVWGKGEEERDLLYISDLVEFINIILKNQKSKFELYNLGYGESISIDNLVKKIIQISGKKIEIQYDLTKPNINFKLCLDSSKARSEMGWHPKIQLENGIRKTIDWYKQNYST